LLIKAGEYLNILQITLGFYPAVGWGGPVKIVYENSQELIRKGHQVTVYCTNLMDKNKSINRGTFEKELNGIRVVYFNTLRIPFWPGTLGPIWLPELKHFLRKECRSFDIIHINGYRNLMVPVITLAAKHYGVPYIIQPHGDLPVIVNSHFIKRIYDRLIGRQELKDLRVLIALQESERKQALQKGIPDEKIKIIGNGLNLSNQPRVAKKGEFRKKHRIPPNVPVILFLGRINKKKGPDMLIGAFAGLVDLNAYLVIAGPDDGQLEEIKTLIYNNNLDNRVILPGLLTGEEIAAAYQDSTIFVLPCRFDTFPTTIMEACYYELPMVITDRCESAYIVKDKIADIVPFNEEAFSNGMRHLLVNQDHYEKYKQNCNKLMEEEFSVKSTVNKLEKLYQDIIQKSN